MKKGETYEGIIEKIEFPNKGILHIDGEKVTVKNALPGQRVSFLVSKKRAGRCEGSLLEVLERSPLETATDVCPHFGSCGGCLYQTLPYEEQLKIKEEQVKTLIDAVCDSYEFEPITGSPVSEGYRNKMEFSFGDEWKDGPAALGMHKRGSFYDVVTTGECRIVHRDFREILLCTKDYFAEKKISFYKKMKFEGYLRHLLVRRAANTGEILIDLITTTQTDGFCGSEEALLREWKERILSLPLEGTMAGILHTKNDSRSDAVIDEGTEILHGRDFFFEELLGMRFKISLFSFFQTNSLGAEVLYEKTREYVGATDGKVVFDLYSGTGTIAQILAPVAEKVVGVEIVEAAVLAARENARLNNLSNCEFLAGDVLKVIDELTDKPDLIVLDPPRDGIHPKAIEKIIDFGVERIVYVSCKPTSLARDLVILQSRGYVVEKVGCVDMFPSTGNVETCVLLSHKKPDDIIEVKMEYGKEDFAYLPPSKVTYQMIQGFVEKKYAFKVHTAYIAEVKRSLGLPMYDAPNAVEELKQPRKHPTPDKVEAIKDALRHFKVLK